MSSGRERAYARRSRTGCRTCRRRHIKCDETPIACKNCASAGWKCDGYDENRLAHPGRGNRSRKDITTTAITSATSLSLQHIAASLPGINLDERRGLAYFQCWTVPKMSSFFDSQLWNSLVLPMSHSDRAVIHAVVALSALHEDIEARGVPLARAEITNHRQRFALEQYMRAMSLLNTRRNSNDPKLRDVVLTCCLLFVVFELGRGLYDDAFVHLRQGLSLLSSFKAADTKFQSSSDPGCSKYIEKSLSDALMNLDSQCALFGKFSGPQLSRFKSDDNEDFRDVMDAREELDIIFRPLTHFTTAVRELALEGESPDSNATRLDVALTQTDLQIALAQYLQRLNRFETRIHRSLDHKSQRALNLIRLHHKTFSITLDTYIDIEDMTYDFHIDGFREMVDLSEEIAKSFNEQKEPNKNNSSRPSLLLDMGIIPPLLYICLKCPCVDTRLRALKCLKEWPHQEGPWDSNLAGLMGKLVLQVEIEQEFKRLSTTTSTMKVSSIRDITYIPLASRITSPGMAISDDQKTAILKYHTRECDMLLSRSERRVLIDEAIW